MQVKTAKIKIQNIVKKAGISTDKIGLIFSKNPLEKKFLEEKMKLFIKEHSLEHIDINIFQVLGKIGKFKQKKVKTKYRGKIKNGKKIHPDKIFVKSYLIEPTESTVIYPTTRKELKKQKKKQQKKERRRKTKEAYNEIYLARTISGKIDHDRIEEVWSEYKYIL